MLRLPYKILKYKLVILRPPYKIVVCREKSELSLGCIMKDGTGGFSGGHVSGAPFAKSGCLGIAKTDRDLVQKLSRRL